MLPVSLSPKFQSLLLYSLRFWATGNFEKNVPNDPKMTLYTTRSKGLHIAVTSIHESQILLYDQPFLRYRPFWDKWTEWPQNYLRYIWPCRVQSQMHPICIASIPEFQISVLFALRPAVFELQTILRKKCTKWPQNDLQHYKVICTPYIWY